MKKVSICSNFADKVVELYSLLWQNNTMEFSTIAVKVLLIYLNMLYIYYIPSYIIYLPAT